MRRQHFFHRCAIGLSMLAVLSACGGGGDSAPATAPSNSNVGPASAEPIDKWLGTYAHPCQRAWGVTDASTGAAIYQARTVTLQTKVSSTRATGSYRMDYYNTSDCSGTARYTLTLEGSDNFLSVDGTVVLDGKSADKTAMGEGVYFPGISFGTSLTINGLRFTGDPYNRQTPATYKDLMHLSAEGDLYLGDLAKPLDANGYPTALTSTPSDVKKTS